MSNTLKFGNGQWATKDGSVLAYNDENDNFKPLPFNFERASSATLVNKDGLIEQVGSGEPRIDYKDSAEGAMLLEPQSTNLETKSNEFSTWSVNTNTTRTVDYIISPDGTLNGTRLQFTANGFLANTNQTSSTQYTVTCYAKRNDSGTQNVGFFINGSGVADSVWEITNEWKRFTYTYTSGNGSFIGIAGVSGADISVYGFQLEEQSYSTSYIPTNGSVATRLADVCNNGGNEQVINSSEGVLYVEIKKGFTPSAFEYLSLSDGTTSNTIRLFFNTSNQIGVIVGDSGVTQVNSTYSNAYLQGQDLKIALKFKQNDFALWVNGVEVITDNSGSIPNVNSLNFGRGDTSSTWYEKTKDLRVYDTALTDSELQQLTS